MKRDQAGWIVDHLRDALEAMEKAGRQIAGLGKAERLRFDDLLREVVVDLEDKLLLPICDQYPDLLPPQEELRPPLLCSELRWCEVDLPSDVTEDRLDQVILSLLRSRWRKTAAFLTDAEKRYKGLGWTISHEATAARLQVLSDEDRIEAVGDLRYWGNSEVRLKDQ